MANFPALKPTARSFQLGQYPVKTYRAMSGAVVRRSFGNKAFGYTLDLQYENVTEETVNAIIDHYNGQQGVTIGFVLPDEVFSGISSTLRAKLRAPASIEWLYAETPVVESIYNERSNVTIKLVGELV